MLSFIPMISLKVDGYSSESALKYFLVQALGSALLISGVVGGLFFIDFFVLVAVSSLLLKLGSAPVHF